MNTHTLGESYWRKERLCHLPSSDEWRRIRGDVVCAKLKQQSLFKRGARSTPGERESLKRE